MWAQPQASIDIVSLRSARAVLILTQGSFPHDCRPSAGSALNAASAVSGAGSIHRDVSAHRSSWTTRRRADAITGLRRAYRRHVMTAFVRARIAPSTAIHLSRVVPIDWRRIRLSISPVSTGQVNMTTLSHLRTHWRGCRTLAYKGKEDAARRADTRTSHNEPRRRRLHALSPASPSSPGSSASAVVLGVAVEFATRQIALICTWPPGNFARVAAAHSGGSRAPAASDRHAARLAFQGVSVLPNRWRPEPSPPSLAEHTRSTSAQLLGR